MARGHQAQQAKEKNAKEAAKKAKSGSQLTAQKVGLKISCKLCLAPMTNYKCLVQHYEAKHPKEKCPTEEEI
ncbi:unnamed protein product [Amoebophrya sp. A25]|nr:unnamed protein product [Amoebophrya sp. A25]|eukprot:GSA25T00012399001.1